MSTAVLVAITAAVAVLIALYGKAVYDKISVANEAMDKPSIVAGAEGVFAKIWAKLLNWKTVILSGVSAVTGVFSQIPADTVKAWGDLPWSNVVDQHVASWISIATAILIPIVHAQGIAKAALTPPGGTTEE